MGLEGGVGGGGGGGGGGVVVVMSSFLSLRLRVTPLLWYAFVSHTVRVVCCGFGNYSGVSAESNKLKF